MPLCIYIMEGYTFKRYALKTTYQTFAFILTLCNCFTVYRISSAAVFVDTIWAFLWKNCRFKNTRHSDKIPLGTRIHWQDNTASVIGHTRVAPYRTEYNPRRCWPIHRSVQCNIISCTYGYRQNRNFSQTMPTFFPEQTSNRAVHWVF